jgi:hypothetical protein
MDLTSAEGRKLGSFNWIVNSIYKVLWRSSKVTLLKSCISSHPGFLFVYTTISQAYGHLCIHVYAHTCMHVYVCICIHEYCTEMRAWMHAKYLTNIYEKISKFLRQKWIWFLSLKRNFITNMSVKSVTLLMNSFNQHKL